MKRILLHVDDDLGFGDRLETAVAVAKSFRARLLCTQITPFDSFIMGDPLGGVYALPTVAARLAEEEEELRCQVSERLNLEALEWDWAHFDGHPGHVMLQQSRLADLVILSLPTSDENDGRLSLAADLAIHARAPVMALPVEGANFRANGTAVVAWDGSSESAHALRLATPLLHFASGVHLLTILNDRIEVSAEEGVKYLSDHGIEAHYHERLSYGSGSADALMTGADELDASYLVAGAYGHSRLREAVLGGTTRALLARSGIPLVLAH